MAVSIDGETRVPEAEPASAAHLGPEQFPTVGASRRVVVGWVLVILVVSFAVYAVSPVRLQTD